ncbi:hypothetical protein [Flavobacterium oreochromis]|uniref:hypothetical protein n=1 Tax=Flavobacterium oreochromis TaxID=2906078 RepID=UPI00385C5764
MESLLKDLHQAATILSEYTGGYSGKYTSAETFHKDLVNKIQKLENGDKSVLPQLWHWFAPTCQWDDFVGTVALGEQLFQKLERLSSIEDS